MGIAKKTPAERAAELNKARMPTKADDEFGLAITEENENSKYLMHTMRFMGLESVDLHNPDMVRERVSMYFQACVEDDMKPTLMGCCVALGIGRKYFYVLREGTQSTKIPKETIEILKKTSDMLNAQMEMYMQNGKINPVSGIFLMKNNYGYTDEQKLVVEPTQNLGDRVEQNVLDEKYRNALPDGED